MSVLKDAFVRWDRILYSIKFDDLYAHNKDFALIYVVSYCVSISKMNIPDTHNSLLIIVYQVLCNFLLKVLNQMFGCDFLSLLITKMSLSSVSC